MRFYILNMLIGAGLLWLPTVAHADLIELTREVEIVYTGRLDSGPNDNFRTYDPTINASSSSSGGDYTPYGGELPTYPIQVGDEVSFTINATLPTRAYIDLNSPPPSDDGLYYFRIGNRFPSDVAFVRSVETSAPFDVSPETSAETLIAYNYETDSYSVSRRPFFEIGIIELGEYGVPTYLYNTQTGQYELCGTGASQICGDSRAFTDFLALPLDPTADRFTNPGGLRDSRYQSGLGIPVGTTGPAGSLLNTGLFNLVFSGGWSFNYDSSGGPTPVPAPGMLLLFGLAALAVFARLPFRRKQAEVA